jgi:hypothetical protein
MELTYDWRSFQSVFYPQKRTMNIHLETQDSGVIFAVVENGTVIAAYDENEDLADFIGVGVETLKVSHPHRKVVSLDREIVDGWIQTAVTKPHLYEQIDFFRKSAAPQLESKVRNSLERKTCTAEKHFLLNGLMGAWSKVLPSAFGVFIRLEKAPRDYLPSPMTSGLNEKFGPRFKEYLDQEQDILILFRGGKLEAFYEPDLSSMGQDRRMMPPEVVKYLSEKHSVPVQGIITSYVDWVSWGQSEQPFRMFNKSLHSKQSKLVPFNWKLVSILAARAVVEF